MKKDTEEFVNNPFKKLKTHWIFGKRSFKPWTKNQVINPLVNMILTRSGLLPLATLYYLQKEELSGSEVIDRIDKSTCSTWSTNPGAVYPLLRELKKNNFVECQWNFEEKHPKRVYKITSKGKKEYQILKIILKKQLSEAINIFKKIYDDIFSKRDLNNKENMKGKK